ncbi:zinc finger CCCH domain protein [Medicago truncatula]|uniref:Zinc finger CCCH domain protein n=1 Tax=Medicago truncatula TaxID=3880 RepID=A0A072UWT4_MEDTR|nr:zinc finger CCCH domain protein [Medicago truncatula]
MCNSANGKPCQISLIRENEYGTQELHHKISALLEFSAKDVDEVGLWYGRKIGSKEMSYEERTPLMIAALFGSKGVLSYILGTGRVNVSRPCGSDRGTALHFSVTGCSAASAEIIKLLVDASADGSVVDENDNWCNDLIVSVSNSISGSKWFPNVEQQQDVCTPRTEKKDYPIDPSIPGIKNEIYSTDEFRMFAFKGKPCLRAYPHDWTNKGDACEYAHGICECWLHPGQYRTRHCKDETCCTRSVCIFAHKPEELRPLYDFTGSAFPSPTSYSNSPSSSLIDSFTLSSPSSLIQSASRPPLTPSATTLLVAGTMWKTRIQLHVAVPTLQMPISRFNTALNARNDVEFLELKNHLSLQSPSNRLAGVNPTNLENFFGSVLHSPTSMQVHQNANQQLWGYPSNLSNSNVSGSPQFRVDAFSKRSHSFIECNSRVSFNSLIPTSVAMEPSTFSGWGSLDGKLDWSICGYELNKMRKSYSFGFRNRSSTSTAASNIDVIQM